MVTGCEKSPYYQLASSSSKCSKLISPNHVRFVKRDIRLSPFRSLFRQIAKNARTVHKQMEDRKKINVLKVLNEVIPLQYFGIVKHRKLFYNIVKLMLTRSVHECIYVRQIIQGICLSAIPWLAKIYKENSLRAREVCRRYFYEAQMWLLKKIVTPLISRIYAPVKKGQTHEIELVPRRIWMSFQKKVINNLEKMGHLIRTVEPIRPRGVLQIRPKSGYYDPIEFRPIMRLIHERTRCIIEQKMWYRKVGKILRDAAGKMSQTKTSGLYGHWKNYISVTEGQRIYGIKVDVKDAFGNININSLCYILEMQCEAQVIPLNVKVSITHHIQNQFITIGKTKSGAPKIWQWKHGLLQGDRFSSALCQLYMSFLDSVYLAKFYTPTTFLHRTVDDYFFCSTNEAEVEQFVQVISSVHTLNTNKTQSNLAKYGNNIIDYCGQAFVMHTKQVRGLYSFKKRTEVRHRFRFWNVQRPIFYKQNQQKTIEEFLSKPMMSSSNSYRFKNMELNTVFNDEGMVMTNYFEAATYLAFKFDALVMAVYCVIKNFSLVTITIKKTAYKYAQKAIRKLQQNKGRYYSGLLTLQVFLKVGIQAFVLVLKKRTLYKKHNILGCLTKYMSKIHLKNEQIDWRRFKAMPKSFNNISIQRKLPHHKKY